MKFIIQQRPIAMGSLLSRMMNPASDEAGMVFDIADDRGNELGIVKKMYDPGQRSYCAYDNKGNMTIQIRRNLMNFPPACEIETSEGYLGTVTRAMSFGALEYEVDFGGYSINGNAFSHQYKVTQNGDTVMEISMDMPGYTRRYVLDVSPSMDEVTAVALLLAIDCVNDSKRR